MMNGANQSAEIDLTKSTGENGSRPARRVKCYPGAKREYHQEKNVSSVFLPVE
jgi:hypothetical protein